MRRRLASTLFAALAGTTLVTAQTADAPLQIARAQGAITVDGALDDPGWTGALLTELRYEWFPGDNVAPPVETEVLLAFDDEHLYLGFRCFDPRPEEIRAHLMDRDEVDTFVQDDHVVFMLDTYNDERRGFQFRVNPLGVQADAIFSELEGIEDFSWDVIWQSAGQLTEFGYVVEVALPLDQLRFQPGAGEQTWGFDLGRSYPRSSRHRISNTVRSRDNSCLLCQAAKVRGFADLKPGRNLVVTPTVTVDRTDRRTPFPNGSIEGGEEDTDPGISVRWGVTPNITLNATVNPDFSQVEADVAQLDVNERFALFFPERRPFFLEGSDFFATLMPTVFTRTVADPDWGTKLTGKTGANAFGVFATQDRVTNLLFPSNQGSALTSIDDDVLGSVLRYRRDVGKGSTLGVIYTGREGDDYHNRVAGIDGFFRFNAIDTLSIQYLRSDTLYPREIATQFGQPDDAFDAGAFEALYSHAGRDWQWFARYRDFDPGFRADSGFMPRVDLKRSAFVLRRIFWGAEDDWYDRTQITGQVTYAENHAGETTDEELFLNVNVSGPLQSFLQASFTQTSLLNNGIFHEDMPYGELFGSLQPNGSLRLSLFASAGETVDFANNQKADEIFVVPSVEAKIGRHLNLKLDHTFQQLDDSRGRRLFDANLSQLRVVYNVNVRMFARAIFQYRDIERRPENFLIDIAAEQQRLFTQLLFSYKLNPQTVLFLGYSDNRLGLQNVDLTQADRTFFVKLGYAWVL